MDLKIDEEVEKRNKKILRTRLMSRMVTSLKENSTMDLIHKLCWQNSSVLQFVSYLWYKT